MRATQEGAVKDSGSHNGTDDISREDAEQLLAEIEELVSKVERAITSK